MLLLLPYGINTSLSSVPPESAITPSALPTTKTHPIFAFFRALTRVTPPESSPDTSKVLPDTTKALTDPARFQLEVRPEDVYKLS
ncbi:hypothetical protein CROQUDRAFT_87030 [Cronartium quercuum f. sp. fusiforme G11]|uniref:Uncharacterized protein n=1 Tax=Cronartium quercuum f. sp. fusiforme G11 TaxID=708437 RepID=A0A9P6NVT0_9BASI|nr:hypothetical protein CROQUDRAFT_87030 [Cronartium quercuum f. sp. fusiforme G11]